jgi:hypothetical protein
MSNETILDLSTIPATLEPAGCSHEARLVEDRAFRMKQSLYASYSLGTLIPRVINELNSLASECQLADWDGHDASPLSSDSLDLARRFLLALPLGVFVPTLGAEPDGQVTAEWYRSPRYVLSVSFDPKGDLHYASLRGFEKDFGSLHFLGSVPKRILDIISEMGFLSREQKAA